MNKLLEENPFLRNLQQISTMQSAPAPISLNVPDAPDLPRNRQSPSKPSDARPAAPHPPSEMVDHPGRSLIMNQAAPPKGPKKRGRPKKSAEPEEGKKAPQIEKLPKKAKAPKRGKKG